ANRARGPGPTSSSWRSGMRRVTCGWPRAMTGRWVSTTTTASSSTARNAPTSSGSASRCTAWCAEGSVLLLSRGRLLLGGLALISGFALISCFALSSGFLRGRLLILRRGHILGLVGGLRVGLVHGLPRSVIAGLDVGVRGLRAGGLDRCRGLIGSIGGFRLRQFGGLGHLARSQQDAPLVQVPGDGLALLVQLIDMPLGGTPFPIQLGGGVRTQPVGGLPRLPGDPIGALACVAEDLLGLGLGLGT